MSETNPDLRTPRERLLDLVEWAREQDKFRQAGMPSAWEQDWWIRSDGRQADVEGHCGTACCIAGKVALEDGGVPCGPIDARGEMTTYDYVRFPNAEVVSVEDYARRVLGLTYVEADTLFAGSNGLADVERAVRDILADWAEDGHPDGI